MLYVIDYIENWLKGFVNEDFIFFRKNENLIDASYYYSYKTELMIIGTRCLLPSKENNCVFFQLERLEDEMALYPYYRHYTKKFRDEDEYLYLGIPLMFANNKLSDFDLAITDYLISKFGVTYKFIEAYITLIGIYISIFQSEFNNKDNRNKLLDSVMKLNWNKLIIRIDRNNNFSSSDSIKIDFEKAKVEIINGFYGSGKYKHKEFLKAFIEGKDRAYNKIYNISDKEFSYENRKFIDAIIKYIVNIRKGRIDYSKLVYKRKNDINIFDLNTDEKVMHSLFGYVQKTNKFVRNGIETVLVNTKAGEMRFRRRIAK